MRKKSLLIVTLTIIQTILLLCGCKHEKTMTEEVPMQGKVFISGHIKNRDLYPHINDIVLELPFFDEGQITYTSLINSENNFYFNFQLHSQMCEVAINPYIEHLYVQPGDSINLEIDFKDLLNVVIDGNGAELNKQFTSFIEGGYYIQDYRIWKDFTTNEEFEQLMEQEYQERLHRYDEYVTKYQPNEKVKEYISQLIKADYYTALFQYAIYCQIYGMEGFDLNRYANRLGEASLLLDNRVITNAHFRLSKEIYSYLFRINERFQNHDQTVTMDDIFSPMKDTHAMPYLYTQSLASSLYELNDTTYFNQYKECFDQYVKSPYLRNTVLQLQQSKKNYQENPKPVSDYILYGNYQDGVKALKSMSYMECFYNLLNSHRGKMIYIDFWNPGCPPCMHEMKPLKELRQKFSIEDIVFISICNNNNKELVKKVLDTYEMHIPGIEHVLTIDWPNGNESNKLYNQLNVNSLPYYFIINREGVIVNYGSMMRPSYHGTEECIKQWLGAERIES
ncbi:MAG: TlpA family protein disulfide reductase [Bacteroidaceae bacterium]|nr:TlpA family protein disulfide reductase [Bacteroidaceae bacterium]